jgi:hypothetical protein
MHTAVSLHITCHAKSKDFARLQSGLNLSEGCSVDVSPPSHSLPMQMHICTPLNLLIHWHERNCILVSQGCTRGICHTRRSRSQGELRTRSALSRVCRLWQHRSWMQSFQTYHQCQQVCSYNVSWSLRHLMISWTMLLETVRDAMQLQS